MPNTNEIAAQIEPRLKGSRIIGFQGAQGDVIGYTFVMENEKEERAYLTISAILQSSLGGNQAIIHPAINTSLTEWRK